MLNRQRLAQFSAWHTGRRDPFIRDRMHKAEGDPSPLAGRLLAVPAELPASQDWKSRFSASFPIRRKGALHTYSCLEIATQAPRVALFRAPDADTSRSRDVIGDIARLHRELDHPLIPKLAKITSVRGEEVLLFDCDAVTDMEAVINHWAERRPPQLQYDASIGMTATLLDVLEHAHARSDPASGRPICMGGMRWRDILVARDGTWWFTFGRNHHPEIGVQFAPEVAAGAAPNPGADLYAMQMLLRTAIPYVQVPQDMMLAFRNEATPETNAWFRWIDEHLLAGKPELRPKSVAEMRPQNEAHWKHMGVRPDAAALRTYLANLVREIAGAGEALEPSPDSTVSPHSDSAHGGCLRVSSDGRWFTTPDGKRVDISRRGALRRIVATLAAHRVHDPGRASSVDELVAVGWPNQKLLPHSATNRLYVAVSTLRGLGIGVQRRDDGYLLPPSLPVELMS